VFSGADLENRKTQAEFPAMADLDAAVAHEIAWQKAMWDGNYAKAFEAARDVLGKLNDPGLRGYRALWPYLAGSAARLAVEDSETSLEEPAKAQFRQAKDASSGTTWLIGLARGGGATSIAEERVQATVMLQVERLEAQLQRLGTLHNRAFSARERDIREGLRSGDRFEAAQGSASRLRSVQAKPTPHPIPGGRWVRW
jgi:hypothetical protein